MIPVDDYVAFLESDYLRGYVEDGGAALKFVVPPDDLSAAAFIERFSASAERAGFGVAKVNAAETRVHLLEQVFFAVARQVDWDGLATVATRAALASAGYPARRTGRWHWTGWPPITASSPGSSSATSTASSKKGSTGITPWSRSSARPC